MRLLNLILTLSVTTGCAGFYARHSPVSSCEIAVGRNRFDSARATELAGAYEIEMISEWQVEPGKIVRGEMRLWTPDTLFQYYDPEWYMRRDSATHRIVMKDSVTRWLRISGRRPLIGNADVDLRKVSAPMTKQLRSEDPFAPGMRLEGANLQFEPVRLGYVQLDGSSTAVTIRYANENGFRGTWITSFFGTMMRNGREVPNPSGRFCALRMSNGLARTH